eukprot:CAMPEP_0183768422 /NCGR_PEP_ID=MMETSP0739-20130205/16733_1 /TAXON_ID=385413 /ORGANISM="Thalassiosira miniscula, Strain CCMP1093" /LENGTH=874 /DNA_ID=CAMNT_0026007653 /DNA_START=27 /DNA_END=2648 /DNA_ORIENTATION=-
MHLLLLLLASLLLLTFSCEASIRINEVAYKGSSPNICNGEDWIELVATASNEDLINYTLHDDKGKDDDKAKYFNESMPINVGEYLVLCREVDFDFGIGSDDGITLLDENGNVVSEAMLLGDSVDDQTFAFFDNDDEGWEQLGGYQYTASPTPGEKNIYTTPKPLEVKLDEQNKEGNAFFLDGDNYTDMFDKVVDIHVQLSDESLATIVNHPTWEEFVPFEDVAVSNPTNGKEVSTATVLSSGPGKIRTKGQSTLMITACLGFKNVPFQIEFDTSFMGMEIVYLRNHLGDASYMRDYASHLMLKRFGLPYLRSRPARLYMNGEYVGFYTLLEAPVQGYVMQRSFGVFEAEQTSLYKVKTQLAECPITDPDAIAAASTSPLPNPYYFERGDHRADVPSIEGDSAPLETCSAYFFGEMAKEGVDLAKGILHYNNSCGNALVSLGRVDRDYGPKSSEDAMIKFVDSVMVNTSVSDIKPYIDSDQWIKNFAAYAVTLNQDSVIDIVNNWYLGTVDGGNSWAIVQYDHNSIATRDFGFCGEECIGRLIYRPILRPSCGSVEDHPILGRVLNDEESWDTYLKYVEEFVGVVESSIPDLRSYGNGIKAYMVDDPLAFGQTVEAYERSELGLDYSDYNTEAMPLLKTLSARLDEVKAQLNAIQSEALPRDGVYGKDESCPDWRDDDGSDYLAGSAFDESCGIPDCEAAAPCYANSPSTCVGGSLVVDECKQASPFCDACYPASYCGSGLPNSSGEFVESDSCGALLADCKLGSPCFDHKSGVCAFDGSILIEECREAELFCKPCFPKSRCGTPVDDEAIGTDGDSSTNTDDNEETFTSNSSSPSPAPEDDTPTPKGDVSTNSASKWFTTTISMNVTVLIIYYW